MRRKHWPRLTCLALLVCLSGLATVRAQERHSAFAAGRQSGAGTHYVEPPRPTRHAPLSYVTWDREFRLPRPLIQPATECGIGGCGLFSESCLGERCRLLTDAWISQGVTINGDRPQDRFNGPVTYNDRSNDYQLNQLYLSLGRRAHTDGLNWDWGGQIDILAGSDYAFVTANGLETHSDGTPKWNDGGPRRVGGEPTSLYGVAIPQLAAELYLPECYEVNLQLGRFYSLVGFESVRAPQNFFYSHSYMFQYGRPRTLTGIKATRDLDPNTVSAVALARGWDAWYPNRDDSFTFMWQTTWTSNSENLVIGATLLLGREETLLQSMDARRQLSLTVARRVTQQTMCVFEFDYGIQEEGLVGVNGDVKSAKWYGFTQYLLHDLTDTLAAGMRLEWFRDQGNSRITSIPVSSLADHANYCGFTMGLNWRPRSYLTIRPELRFDWSDFAMFPPFDGVSGAFDDATDRSQVLAAVDVVLHY